METMHNGEDYQLTPMNLSLNTISLPIKCKLKGLKKFEIEMIIL